MKISGLFRVAVAFAISFFAVASLSAWDGSGTQGDPYQIGIRADLEQLSTDVNAGVDYDGAYFKLMNDINMNNGAVDTAFTPIGSYLKPFKGYFDGNGHVISNLYINLPAVDSVGLLGGINGGRIINLGLVDVDITGHTSVGGLSGSGWADVSGCYVTGRVSGMNYVGGLIGFNRNVVTACYTRATVTATGGMAGGLLGMNLSTIDRCYTAGVTTGSYAGTLIGENQNTGVIINSCFDKTVSGSVIPVGSGSPSDTATIMTTAEMKSLAIGLLNGGSPDTPFKSGNIYNNGGYPALNWQPFVMSGAGTLADPYQIWNRADMDFLSSEVNDGHTFADSYFKVMASFSMGNSNFAPIGLVDSPFMGHFDGGGHSIANLSINRTGNFIGLFGFTQHAQFANLHLESVTVTGGDNTGALVGWQENGSVTNCTANGVIGGNNGVGGLIGMDSGIVDSCQTFCTVGGREHVGGLIGISKGTVQRCITSGLTNGERYVGGLVGKGHYGVIVNCYATSAVSGTQYVGGFVGEQLATITACYAIGEVSTTAPSAELGGFFGYNGGGTVTHCYFDMLTTGQSKSSGGGSGVSQAVGMTTAQMVGSRSLVDALSAEQATSPWKLSGPGFNGGYPVFEGPDFYAVTVNNGVCSVPSAFSGSLITVTADTEPDGWRFMGWESVPEIALADSMVMVTSFMLPDTDVALTALYEFIPLPPPVIYKGSIGEKITVPVDILPLSERSKLHAYYAQPYGKAGQSMYKKLTVKMVKGTNDTFEVKAAARLLNQKLYKTEIKAKRFTRDILNADSIDMHIQRDSVQLFVHMLMGKIPSDTALILHLTVPAIDSVLVMPVSVKKGNAWYAVVRVKNGGSKPIGKLEQGTSSEYKGKLSAQSQKKIDNLPDVLAKVKEWRDDTGAGFRDPTDGLFVFKLNQKFDPAVGIERIDLVIDNKSGLAATTLR